MPSNVGNLPRNGNTFGVTILRRNGSLELLERAGLFQLLHQTFDRFLAPFALDGIVGRGLLPAQQTFHDRRTKLQHFLRQKKGLFRRHSAPVPLASRQSHSLWLPADPEKPVQLCSLYAKCQYFLFLPGGKLRTRFHTTHSSRGGRPMVEENRLLHFCVAAAAASRGTFFSDGTDRLTHGARNNTHRKITMTFNHQNSPQFRVDPADGHCLTDTTGTDYRKTIFRARFFANFLPNFAI